MNWAKEPDVRQRATKGKKKSVCQRATGDRDKKKRIGPTSPLHICCLSAVGLARFPRRCFIGVLVRLSGLGCSFRAHPRFTFGFGFALALAFASVLRHAPSLWLWFWHWCFCVCLSFRFSFGFNLALAFGLARIAVDRPTIDPRIDPRSTHAIDPRST